MSQQPPQPPGATPQQVADAVASTPAPADGVPVGVTPAGFQNGVIVASPTAVQAPVAPATWPTVTITLAGSSTPIASVRFAVGYSPNVGDTVVVAHVGSDLFVIAALSSGNAGASGGPVPVGAEIMCSHALSDPAWLLCDGSSFSGATYPALQAFLGGTTLPDRRNVSPMGAGSTVGLGNTAGVLTHAMTAAEMPTHTHPENPHAHTQGGHNHKPAQGVFLTTGGSPFVAGYGYTGANDASASTTDTQAPTINPTTPTLQNAGSGNAMSILHPVVGMNFYIRAI